MEVHILLRLFLTLRLRPQVHNSCKTEELRKTTFLGRGKVYPFLGFCYAVSKFEREQTRPDILTREFIPSWKRLNSHID